MNITSASPANDAGLDGAAWETKSPAEIIEYILRRFHEPLRRDLPGLVNSARAIEAEATGQPLCPVGLARHLEQIWFAVESHLIKEEKILFPLIQAGRGAQAFMPVKVMMAEHEDHIANLARARMLAHEFALPASASAAWQALYRDLQVVEADLKQHIDIENNVLFPRVMGGENDNL
jgi:regulator of cell morphogenesis and NO signaling